MYVCVQFLKASMQYNKMSQSQSEALSSSVLCIIIIFYISFWRYKTMVEWDSKCDCERRRFRKYCLGRTTKIENRSSYPTAIFVLNNISVSQRDSEIWSPNLLRSRGSDLDQNPQITMWYTSKLDPPVDRGQHPELWHLTVVHSKRCINKLLVLA